MPKSKNGKNWVFEAGTWHGGRPQRRRLCVRRGPSPLPPKRGGAPLPNFRPISIVAKPPDASRCHLVLMLATAQGPCVRWRPSLPSPTKGRSPLPIFGPFLLCPSGWTHEDATMEVGPAQASLCWIGTQPPPQKGGGDSSPILKGFEVRISKLDRKCGALLVVANFVALEQQIILVKTRSESG